MTLVRKKLYISSEGLNMAPAQDASDVRALGQLGIILGGGGLNEEKELVEESIT